MGRVGNKGRRAWRRYLTAMMVAGRGVGQETIGARSGRGCGERRRRGRGVRCTGSGGGGSVGVKSHGISCVTRLWRWRSSDEREPVTLGIHVRINEDGPRLARSHGARLERRRMPDHGIGARVALRADRRLRTHDPGLGRR